MINEAIQNFCNWLSMTPMSVWIQSQPNSWPIAMSQSVHIIAISLVAAGMLRMDARLIGFFGRGQSFNDMADRYTPWTWKLLLVALATGILQTVAEPTRQLMNPSFRMKMLLLAIVLSLTYFAVRQARKQAPGWDALPTNITAKLVGMISICCWVAIILYGRWIAYTQ
jgi:uncharacterized membrane protein